MTEQQKTSENTNEKDIRIHVGPDLDYVYRDVFHVYAGFGDVVIEFGNIHRSMPEHATISNRIVVSASNAYTLIQTLQEALQKAQMLMQQNLQTQKGRPE